MNTRLIFRYAMVTCLLFANCVYFACEDIDEVPPKKDRASSEMYKVADTVVLNADEIAIIDAIKQEYNENVTQ